jgi:hypothetical protein
MPRGGWRLNGCGILLLLCRSRFDCSEIVLKAHDLKAAVRLANAFADHGLETAGKAVLRYCLIQQSLLSDWGRFSINIVPLHRSIERFDT